MKCLSCLAALLLLAGTAAHADERPSVDVKLLGEPSFARAGELFTGRLLITSAQPAEITGVALGGAGWRGARFAAPSSLRLDKDAGYELDFEIQCTDPDTWLEITFDWNGRPLRFQRDLSERGYRRATAATPFATVQAGGRSEPPPPREIEKPETGKPSGDGAKRDIRVYGRVVYTRNGTVTIGVDGMTLFFYDDDPGIDDYLTGVVTDEQGYFDVEFEFHDHWEDYPDIYIEGEAANAMMEVEDASKGGVYDWESGIYADIVSELNVGWIGSQDESDEPALLAPLAAGAAEITSHWDNAGGGVWETDTNWSPIGVPDNGIGGHTYLAVLDLPGPVTVNINSHVDLDSLFVDAEDELILGNSRTLDISLLNGHQGIENRGIIRLDAASTWTHLRFYDGDARLTGGGEIIGQGGTFYGNIQGTAGGLLTNVDNTIRGALHLGYNNLALDNQGTIMADDPDDDLVLDPHLDGMTNTGVIRATNNATLTMREAPYANAGGVIEAVDGGTVELSGTVDIVGGTLQTANGGQIVSVLGSPSIADLTNLGTLRVNNSRSLYWSGAISNQDTIHLDSTSTWTHLRTENGPLTLSGGGAIRGGVRYASLNSLDGSRLINLDNTIGGAMYVCYDAMGLTNQGTLVADDPTYPMIVDPNEDGLINSNLIRAEAGAVMHLLEGDYENTGGVIEAVDGATIELRGTVIVTGGILQTADGGEIRAFIGSPVIVDLTSLGDIHINNSRNLYMEGTIANQDTIHIDSTSTWTRLRPQNGTVTLTGGGTVIGNYRYSSVSSFDGSGLVNQDNTFVGPIYMGYATMGITNAGTLIADHATWPMTIDVNGDGFVNTGTIEVTGAGGMNITDSGPFDQQGVFNIAPGARVDDTDDFVQTAGTTTVDGILDMTHTTDTVELQGGVLQGVGLIEGIVNHTGGTVAPGGAPGVLNIDGDYNQGPGTTLAIDIDGTTPGTGHDVLAITGDAVVAGEVDLTFLAGYTLAVDDTFVVLTAASVTGELTIAPGGSYDPGVVPWVAVRETDVVVTIEQISITGAEDPEDALPVVRPLTVSPNPSPGGRMTIDFALADKSAEAKVVIYDVAGRRVRELNSGLQGGARLTWNGRADDGRPVSAGVYFVRVQARNGHDEVKRVTVVR